MNVTDQELIIRKMRSSSEDFDLLEKWLNDEEVQDYYEGKARNIHENKSYINLNLGLREKIMSFLASLNILIILLAIYSIIC